MAKSQLNYHKIGTAWRTELSGIGTATVDVHDSHRMKTRKDEQILEQDMTMGTDNVREDDQQNIILVKHGERTASRDAS